MGMFDEVALLCPDSGCGGSVLFQSKAADCALSTFTQDEVPVTIASDILGDVGYCENCSSEVTAVVLPASVEVVRMRAVRI